MVKQAYCPHCRKFTDSITDNETNEILCKKCTRIHKRFDFSKLLIGK